jgi:ATP-dependent exoDNAse (exonuclease V) beta subunit
MSAKIELKENFRSDGRILAFVNSAFSQPHLFGAGFMKLGAGRTDQAPGHLGELTERVECLFVDNPDRSKAAAVAEEARLVASRIRQLTDAGVDGGQIAILLRNATNASVFASALESVDVPVLVTAGATLFDTVEAREVMALLRSIAVPTDDERLTEVLASRLVRISDDALLALRSSAGREPLWTAVHAVGEGLAGAADLSQHDAAAVRVAYRAIDDLGTSQGTLSLHELVHAACAAFDYDLTLLSLGPAGLRAWSNVLKIARYAAQYEQIESSDPAAFVDYLKQRSDGANDRAAAAEAGGDAVRIMTIHSAKGLEFPVVFAADLGAGKLRSPDNVLVAKVGEGEGATPVVGLRFKCGDDDESAATPLHATLSEVGQARDLEEHAGELKVRADEAAAKADVLEAAAQQVQQAADAIKKSN